MTNLSQAEQGVAVRIALGENPQTLTSSLPQSLQSQQEVIKRAAESLQAKRAEEALKIAATEFTQINFVSDLIRRAIYTDVDHNNGNPRERENTSEGTDLAYCERRMRLLQDYLLYGYDNIPADADSQNSQTTQQRQQELRDEIGILINSIPSFRDAFAIQGQPGQQVNIPRELIEALLRDSSVRSALAQFLNGIFNPQEFQGDKDLHRKLLEARRKRDSITRELTTLRSQREILIQAINARNDFYTDQRYQSQSLRDVTGTRAEVLRRLGDMPMVRWYINLLEQNDRLFAQLGNNSSNQRQIQSIRRNIEENNIRIQDLRNRHPEVREYIDLSSQQNTLNQQSQEAIQRLPEIERLISETEARETQAINEENDATFKLITRSQEFLSKIRGALREAFRTTINARIEQIITGGEYSSTKTKVKEDIAKRPIEALNQLMERRWIRRNPSRPEDVRLDLQQASQDFLILLRYGPEGLIRQMLQATDLGLQQNQINDLMRDETNFNTSERRKEIASRVLTAYIGAGGRLSENQLRVIATSQWGENIINEVISKNNSIKSLIEQAKQGGIAKMTLGEIIGNRLGWSRFLLILLMGLGIITVGPGVVEELRRVFKI